MCTTVPSKLTVARDSWTGCSHNGAFTPLACLPGVASMPPRWSWAANMAGCAPLWHIARSCSPQPKVTPDDALPGRPARMGGVTVEQRKTRGFGESSSGVWCNDTSPGMVARLAHLGFDWVCLDAQHGGYSRTEILDAARSFPPGLGELVVRVAACDFAAIGAALDAGAMAVIVPQIESGGGARRAVAATFYPPAGERSRGPTRRIWGAPTLTTEEANRSTTCAVMIESARALSNVEEIAAVPGVDQLFVGPHDLSLSLGTSVEELLDDDADTR